MDSLVDSEHVKQEFRQEAIRERSNIGSEVRKRASRKLKQRLVDINPVKTAEVFMGYSATGNELSLLPFLEWVLDRGKKLVLPRVEQGDNRLVPHVVEDLEDREPGFKGILEPDPETTESIRSERIDLILVPGLMYDRSGYRLGYGGGFYDRFLEELEEGTLTVGITYQRLIRDRVPRMEHDQPVDWIVTEEATIQPD